LTERDGPTSLVVAGPGGPETRDLARAVGGTIDPLAAHLPAWASDTPPACLRATALAGRAAGLVSLGLNFRSGELAYHAPREEAKRQLRYAGILLGVTIVLALAGAGAKLTQQRRELARLRQETAATVAPVLPNAPRGAERAQLEASIAELEKRREML